MPTKERRQHFRIIDHIYFDYKIINPGDSCSDLEVSQELLGKNGQKYVDAMHYVQTIDYEMNKLIPIIGLKEPTLAQYFKLLNSKIDFLIRQILMTHDIHLRKVDISLGGMAFQTSLMVKENSRVKIILYTKPRMLPIILDSIVVYSQHVGENHYRTAVTFSSLSTEQEELLSQHILLAQIKNQAD